MIIVVNDKVVQEQMVKEAEQEGGPSVTIPWTFVLLVFCVVVYCIAMWHIVHRKSVWKINIDMKDKEGEKE